MTVWREWADQRIATPNKSHITLRLSPASTPQHAATPTTSSSMPRSSPTSESQPRTPLALSSNGLLLDLGVVRVLLWQNRNWG